MLWNTCRLDCMDDECFSSFSERSDLTKMSNGSIIRQLCVIKSQLSVYLNSALCQKNAQFCVKGQCRNNGSSRLWLGTMNSYSDSSHTKIFKILLWLISQEYLTFNLIVNYLYFVHTIHNITFISHLTSKNNSYTGLLLVIYTQNRPSISWLKV